MTATMEIPSNSEDQIKPREYSTFDLGVISKPPPPSIWLSERFCVGIMLFLGYLLSTMSDQVNFDIAKFHLPKVNFDVAKRTITTEEKNESDENHSFANLAYLMVQVWCICVGGHMLLGHLTQNFGGSKILGVFLFIIGTGTVATSFGMYFGSLPFWECQIFLYLFRVVFLLPACFSAILASWVPRKERCIFTCCVISGMYISDFIVKPFIRYLLWYGNWPMPPQLMGALSITWAVLWLTRVPNMPLDDPHMSQLELDYILRETGNPSPPTEHFLTSSQINSYLKDKFRILTTFRRNSPEWVLLMSKFAIGWTKIIINEHLPNYIEVLPENYIIHRLQIIEVIFIVIIGALMTFWQNHTARTTTQIYKVAICGAFTITAILIATIPITNNLIVSLFLIKLLLSCNMIFLEVVTVNMAPNHSALLSSFTLIGRDVGYTAAITFVKFVVPNHTLQEFNVYILLTAGITFLCGIHFWMFGSSDPQPWSVSSSSDQKMIRGVKIL